MGRTLVLIALVLTAGCGGSESNAEAATTTTTQPVETTTTLDPDEQAIEWIGEDGADALSEWLLADQAAKDGPFLDNIQDPAGFPAFTADVGDIAIASTRIGVTFDGKDDPPTEIAADVEVLLDAIGEVEEAGDALSRCLALLPCSEEFAAFTSVSQRAYTAIDATPLFQDAIDEF